MKLHKSQETLKFEIFKRVEAVIDYVGLWSWTECISALCYGYKPMGHKKLNIVDFNRNDPT